MVQAALRRLAGLALAGLAWACGGEGDQILTPGSQGHAYTGQLEASDARVALVEQDDRVRAYVCGGPATYQRLSRWFSLTSEPGAGGLRRLQGQSEGWVLEGELAADGARGTLRGPDGVSWPWRASRVADGAASGLYEASDDLGKIGAIVDDPGAGGEVAVQGTLLGKGGERAQVTPVRPLMLPGSLRIEILQVGGRTVRQLAPVLPSRSW